MSQTGADNSTLVSIGHIRRAVGLDGRVEVELYSGDRERLAEGKSVFINGEAVTVKSTRPGGRKGTLSVVFEGVEDRDAAEGLRGLQVQVRESDLPPMDESSYYHFEIIGCEVRHAAGENIGTVTGVMETGANDVFVVERADGSETLIPATKSVIVTIDRTNRIITIDPPDGLIS